MKKIIQLIIVLFVILGLFQVVIIFFKKGHDLNYKVTNDNIRFDIDETFKDNRYYFNVSYKEFDIYFSYENKFNKQKKVIENMEYSLKNNMLCIYPVYKEKSKGEIFCSKDNQQYSYQSIDDNNDARNFYNSINEKYKITNPKIENHDYVGAIKYYPEVFNDETITLWTYKGVYKIKKDDSNYQNVLPFDRYENTISRVVDHYYVSPIYTSNTIFEINSFLIWDLDTGKTFNIDLKDFTLSNYTYVLGDVDKKLYLFDKNNIIEVEIDINKKTSKIVANKSTKGKFYDGKWHDKNIYEFVNNDLTFTDSDTQVFNNYSKVYENSYAYYLYDNENMYMVYKNNIGKKILLFVRDDIDDITITENALYFKEGKTIYKYNHTLNKILEYSELEYNKYKLYDIY